MSRKHCLKQGAMYNCKAYFLPTENFQYILGETRCKSINREFATRDNEAGMFHPLHSKFRVKRLF